MFYQTSLFIYSAISPLQVLSRKSEGIVLLYNLTIYRKVLFSSPVFCIAKYRGDVRRTERLILIAQKTHEIFSTPLHRNCRFFGLSPILLTQHPVCFVQQGRRTNTITSSPVFCCQTKYRGGVRRTEGLILTAQKLMKSFQSLSTETAVTSVSLLYC